MTYEEQALLRAEQIGVYEYKVRGHKMTYYSFFGIEGMYKIVHDLKTCTETRTQLKYKKIPKHLNRKYNYFCG